MTMCGPGSDGRCGGGNVGRIDSVHYSFMSPDQALRCPAFLIEPWVRRAASTFNRTNWREPINNSVYLIFEQSGEAINVELPSHLGTTE